MSSVKYSKFGLEFDSQLTGDTGPPGNGFKLTAGGNYDIQNLNNLHTITINYLLLMELLL